MFWYTSFCSIWVIFYQSFDTMLVLLVHVWIDLQLCWIVSFSVCINLNGALISFFLQYLGDLLSKLWYASDLLPPTPVGLERVIDHDKYRFSKTSGLLSCYTAVELPLNFMELQGHVLCYWSGDAVNTDECSFTTSSLDAPLLLSDPLFIHSDMKFYFLHLHGWQRHTL